MCISVAWKNPCCTSSSSEPRSSTGAPTASTCTGKTWAPSFSTPKPRRGLRTSHISHGPDGAFHSLHLITPNLLRIAHIQLPLPQHWMIPCLPFDRLERSQFLQIIPRRRHQRHFSFFRQHNQHPLIGDQYHLPLPIFSLAPFFLAGLGIDAAEER